MSNRNHLSVRESSALLANQITDAATASEPVRHLPRTVPCPPADPARRSETATAAYTPIPIGGALHHDWMGLDVPSASAVRGVVWARRTIADGHHVTVSFRPRDPGVVLSPVAEYLHFAPLSDPEIAAPPAVVLILLDTRLEIHAFDEPLWRTDPLDNATMESLDQYATVLIMDRPAELEASTFPRLPPSLIWAGHVPVRHCLT